MHLLEVTGLSLERRQIRRGWWHRRVETQRVFSDLDFQVGRRESLALVSACREANLELALALAGERTPLAGEIRLAGVPLETRDPRRLRRIRKKVRFLFPDASGSLPPDRTVRECFREVTSTGPVDSGVSPVEQAMVRCGLPEAVQDLYPLELDAVERQSVALARCLLADPDLIVLCGFTEGLDAVQAMELTLRLARVREETRVAMLILGDDLARMAPLADRVGILHGGRLLESGATPDLLERPGHDYTQRLVACAA